MYEPICFFAILDLPISHSGDIYMRHTFHNGESVLEHCIDAFVSISTKVIDNFIVPRQTNLYFLHWYLKQKDGLWVQLFELNIKITIWGLTPGTF